jgi:hypothetical protein
VSAALQWDGAPPLRLVARPKPANFGHVADCKCSVRCRKRRIVAAVDDEPDTLVLAPGRYLPVEPEKPRTCDLKAGDLMLRPRIAPHGRRPEQYRASGWNPRERPDVEHWGDDSFGLATFPPEPDAKRWWEAWRRSLAPADLWRPDPNRHHSTRPATICGPLPPLGLAWRTFYDGCTFTRCDPPVSPEPRALAWGHLSPGEAVDAVTREMFAVRSAESSAAILHELRQPWRRAHVREMRARWRVEQALCLRSRCEPVDRPAEASPLKMDRETIARVVATIKPLAKRARGRRGSMRYLTGGPFDLIREELFTERASPFQTEEDLEDCIAWLHARGRPTKPRPRFVTYGGQAIAECFAPANAKKNRWSGVPQVDAERSFERAKKQVQKLCRALSEDDDVRFFGAAVPYVNRGQEIDGNDAEPLDVRGALAEDDPVADLARDCGVPFF